VEWVEWVEWDSNIIPVKIFIFDVTDTGKRLNGSTGFGPENGCQVRTSVLGVLTLHEN
jgi:hypothetical protein